MRRGHRRRVRRRRQKSETHHPQVEKRRQPGAFSRQPAALEGSLQVLLAPGGGAPHSWPRGRPPL